MPVAGRRARIALAITILLSLPFSFTEIGKLTHAGAGDFSVYFVAAQLVRQHHSFDIYDGADTGRNPQLRPAPVGSPLYQVAAADGIANVGVYVYPPTLADALLPLTYLSYGEARIAWMVINGAALALTALLVCWMLDLPILGWQCLATFCALLLFRTTITAAYWGQVTIVLLALWTAGIVLYQKRFVRAAAMVLAFTAAIKLTPALVVLPILFWKDWRFLRWFIGAAGIIAMLLCLINGFGPLADFVAHVVPPMSAGIPGILNASLAGGIELATAAAHGVDVVNTYFIDVSRGTVVLTKIVSFAVLIVAAIAIFRLGTPASRFQRAKILAMTALLSVCVAPVSWRHAYTVAIPILFILWYEAFLHVRTWPWLAFLGFCTMEFGFVFDSLFAKFSSGIAYGAIPLLGPVCGITLILFELVRMKRHATRAVTT